MPHPEYQYLNLLENIINNGIDRGDRTGTGTRSIFGSQMRFDLSKGFPLLTTKKMFTRGIFHELVWFLRGDTNIKYLADNDVHIWDDWPYKNYVNDVGTENALSQKDFIEKIKSLPKEDEFVQKYGDLGPVYGYQWRNYNNKKIDQLQNAIDLIKKSPESRRIIVNAWNPQQVDSMLLPPCHCLYQFYVGNGKLSLHMYQRSADMFLGVPFNIASYSALLIVISKITGYKPGEFIHTIGDSHIYHNHFEQVETQLSRKPLDFPTLEIARNIKDINNIEFEDFILSGYESYPAIKAPIAV
ncbi:thymidylate synthase [Candidatus Absconditicoccus praedator]|uniref:thymidylate synthase n=1 Tax=Candidatus Absconditicoccus praedator TaxID=2735562 RepID=UPI001E3F2739|nr:thymidylate synthase [Candidatus Absconditicoccus praedator]UFX82698.1 thymidylate synthase [Candidatus Absconditicoccus praedator]